MRWAAITIIILAVAALISWVRAGQDFHIAQVFPFLGGYEPGIYDAAAVILIFMAVRGLRRLARRERDDG
jgi:hypothetical protein